MATSAKSVAWLLKTVLLLSLLFSSPGLRAEAYLFGVLNQQSAAEAAALWNPILEYLQNKTGLDFRFRMGATVKETDAMTARGEFDFLYSNHNFDPEYNQANYIPLVQWGGHPLIGQIVVRDDSPIRELKELEGKTVVFPSKDAFIAYMVTQRALRQAGISVKQEFGASQQGTAIHLQIGRADAASLNKMFAERFQAEGKGKFRVLYESETWPNIPVLAHPRVPPKHQKIVQQTLLNMSNDADGKVLLEKLKIKGFLPVRDADYTATRLLYNEKY